MLSDENVNYRDKYCLKFAQFSYFFQDYSHDNEFATLLDLDSI